LKVGFDFWDLMIDHKHISAPELPSLLQKKESFVSIASDREDYEGIAPSKKIKTE
jgi:hypothetical protein